MGGGEGRGSELLHKHWAGLQLNIGVTHTKLMNDLFNSGMRETIKSSMKWSFVYMGVIFMRFCPKHGSSRGFE